MASWRLQSLQEQRVHVTVGFMWPRTVPSVSRFRHGIQKKKFCWHLRENGLRCLVSSVPQLWYSANTRTNQYRQDDVPEHYYNVYQVGVKLGKRDAGYFVDWIMEHKRDNSSVERRRISKITAYPLQT